MAYQVSPPMGIEDSTFEEAKLSALEASSPDAARYEEAELSALEASSPDALSRGDNELSAPTSASFDWNELPWLESDAIVELTPRFSLIVPSPHQTQLPLGRDPAGHRLDRVRPLSPRVARMLPRPSENPGEEWSADDWVKIARIGRIPPLLPDLERHTETTCGDSKQGAGNRVQRLSIERQVAQLDGQRRLLALMVVTLVTVTGLFHTVAVRPQSDRQKRLIAQLNQVNAAQRSEFEQERGRLKSRILQLDARLATVRARPDTPLPARVSPQIVDGEPSQTIAPKLTRTQSSRVLELATTAPSPKMASPRLESSPSGQPTVSETVQQLPVVNGAQRAGDTDLQPQAAPNDAQMPPSTSDNAREASASTESPQAPALMEAIRAVAARTSG